MSSVVLTGADKAEISSAEVHLLPCHLNYTGPANVTSYFIREAPSDESTGQFATFRGHWMHGAKFVPQDEENLQIFLAKESSSSKGSKRIFQVENKLDSFTIWDEETVNSTVHPVFRAVSHMHLADALSAESDVEENNEEPAST
uniref:PH_RBD domain-containing protein n=1 Tax=Steinernema glaseri TaxID=37863 RepID=A0A1I7XZQ7_9BILA